MSSRELLQYYREHCMSVDQAMSLIKSDDFIVDGHGHGLHPQSLDLHW